MADNLEKVYGKIADEFRISRKYDKWSYVEKFLSNCSGLVLDLGCGSGRNMIRPNLNIEFIGIDFCQNFIDICKNQGLNVIKGDLCHIPLEEDKVDNIICIATFHHLDTEQKRITSLKEIRRVMKTGGKALISVWSYRRPEKQKSNRVFNLGINIVPWKNKAGETFGRYYYIFNHEEKELEKLIEKCGFVIESYEWNYGNDVYVIS